MGRGRGERGATGLEYGLLVAGIALTTLVGASAVGPLVADAFACVAQTMSDPSSGSGSCPSGSGGVTVTDPSGGGTGGTAPDPTAGPAPAPTTAPPDPGPTTPSTTASMTPSPTPSTTTATP